MERFAQRKLYNDIDAHCEHQCRHKDCIKKTFIPRQISTSYIPDKSNFEMNLFIRQTPVLVATCLPQYSFTQFGTDLCSTVGFWFGLSAFGSLSHVINMFKFLFSKTSTKAGDKRKKRKRTTESRKDNYDRLQPKLQIMSKEGNGKHTEFLPTHHLECSPCSISCCKSSEWQCQS